MNPAKLTAAAVLLIMVSVAVMAMPPDSTYKSHMPAHSAEVDFTTYIDANIILMFVTNYGSFGRDVLGVFGRPYYGTFYPYESTEAIHDGTWTKSPLYAAGLWLGGKVGGQVRVAVCEYSSEFVPGSMCDSTFLPDRPEFRVYKLYQDSLEGNPNEDYLNWPVALGAPVDGSGKPLMLGDQMLWTVYNDADPDEHSNRSGETAPLGIEVRQTVWAAAQAGDDSAYVNHCLPVEQVGNSQVAVKADVVDRAALTGHDYQVQIDDHPTLGRVWRLVDITTMQTLLDNQTTFWGDNEWVTDGFVVRVTGMGGSFECFSVVENGAGPLDPPVAGAFAFRNFPTPVDGFGTPKNPEADQQVGSGLWGFHTVDNGGTYCGGTRADYASFLSRVTRDGANLQAIGVDDYEMRFTGSNENPGVGGSYAFEGWADPPKALWVPFELWNIGTGTPDDPSDDVRLCLLIIDDAGEDWEGDDIYALESWGLDSFWVNPLDPSDSVYLGGGDLEHSASGGYDDPYTDWVYWYNPADMSPGEVGYQAFEDSLLIGSTITSAYNTLGDEIMARTVLVNWNGGVLRYQDYSGDLIDTTDDGGPLTFTQDCPEQGTVFRITTPNELPVDTFAFTATAREVITGGPESFAIYIKYKLYNRGPNAIDDFYAAFWIDPDLGFAGDDYVGCDTLNDIFFCYNAHYADEVYWYSTPAMGFRIIHGLVAPAQGEVAVFDGAALPDHKNLGMTSFNRIITGPRSSTESYLLMQGLLKDGTPLPNGSLFMMPGDPVAGTGDLDSEPADRRMMASCGPVTFNPGDSQYVLLKFAVGQSHDRLSSLTRLKEVLMYSTGGCCVGIRGNADGDLEDKANIADITYLISYLFGMPSGPPPLCMEEGNANGDFEEKVNISDIAYLVRYLFGIPTGPAPPACP